MIFDTPQQKAIITEILNAHQCSYERAAIISSHIGQSLLNASVVPAAKQNEFIEALKKEQEHKPKHEGK